MLRVLLFTLLIIDARSALGAKPNEICLLRQINGLFAPTPGNLHQIQEWLASPSTDVDSIIQFLSQDPKIKKLYRSRAGNYEVYTIRTHTERVAENYLLQTKNFRFETASSVKNVRLTPLMKATIALHDIGKPLALAKGSTHLQHQFTLPILEKKLLELGFSLDEIGVAKALVDHDVLGDLAKGIISPEEAYVKLVRISEKTPFTPNDFYRLQKDFYIADAAAYPGLRESVFRPKKDVLQPISPRFKTLDQLYANSTQIETIEQKIAKKQIALLKKRKPIPEIRLRVFRDQIQKNLSSSVEKNYATSGYPNSTELIADLEKSGGYIGASWRALREGKYHFGIRRPESARDSLATIGFTNIHESRLSSAYLFNQSPELGLQYAKEREVAEAILTRNSVQKYAQIPAEAKPTYGYLLPKKIEAGTADVDLFGSDLYVLKNNTIESHTTFTPGDSLDRIHFVDRQWFAKEKAEITAWDQTFVPWKNRELIPLSLAQGKTSPWKAGEPFLHIEGSMFSIQNLRLEKTDPLRVKDFKFSIPYPRAHYIELQFWKKMNLENVESFYFSKNPPEGEFLETLIKHQVQIFDARNPQSAPVRWLPR